MTEEVQGQVNQPEQAPTEPQVSSLEQRAMEMGWRPKEEFNGNEEDFIDAKEFVRRQPLFDKISHQSQQLRKVHESLNEFKQHYAKVEQAAFDRAIKELKAEQKVAIKDGDLERYHELQEDIEAQREQAEQALEVAQKHEPSPAGEAHPEFQSWQARNPWYNQQGYMKAFADEHGLKLARQGMSPGEVLKAVEKAVREEFPNKFRNSNKDNAPQLENSGNGSKSSGRSSKDYQLSDVERKVMNDLVSRGALTKEQYIADLRKIKGE